MAIGTGTGRDKDGQAHTLLGWLGRLWPARPSAIDPAAALLSAGDFLRKGGRLQKASRGRPLTLMAVAAADIAGIEAAHGPALAARVQRLLVRRLLAVAGARGLAGCTGPNAFALLLPGVDEDGALQAMQAALGLHLQLVVHGHAAGGDVVRVLTRPVCMARQLEPGGQPLADWLDDLDEDVAQALRWRGLRTGCEPLDPDELAERAALSAPMSLMD